MITHKKIDIFATDSRSVIIAHQCNCCAVMGRGLALQVKTRYPDAYSSDMAYHWPVPVGQPNVEKLGDFSFAYVPQDGRWIFNLYGQFRYGHSQQHTDYDALFKALVKAKNWCIEMEREGKTQIPKILAVPYLMGSDRGGGDWNVVHALLEDAFLSSHLDLWICER